MANLIPQLLISPIPGVNLQNAYIPLVGAAVANETAVWEAVSQETIAVNDTLVWNVHVPQFNGDPIKLYQGTTYLGAMIEEAGRHTFTLSAANTSQQFRLIAGTNPGGGGRHVIGEWTIER